MIFSGLSGLSGRLDTPFRDRIKKYSRGTDGQMKFYGLSGLSGLSGRLDTPIRERNKKYSRGKSKM